MQRPRTALIAWVVSVVASGALPLAAGEIAARWKLGYQLAASTLVLKQPPPQVPPGYARYSWNRLQKAVEPAAETFDPRTVFGEDTAYPPNLFRKSFRFSDQWSSNALGFRGKEIEVPKPAGTYRIVCLGGSTTEGIGVSNEDTYPAQLERALAGHDVGGRRIEVVNAGFAGFGSQDLYYVLRNLVLPLEPDLLVYYEVGNRVVESEFYRRGPREERRVVQWIANHFALYRAMRQITGVPAAFRQDYSFTEHRMTPSLERYLSWMGSIADLAAERGVPLAIAEPVHGYISGLWTSSRVPADVEWQWERWRPLLPEHIAMWYEATAFHMAAFASRRRLTWIPLRRCVPADRENFLYHNPTMYDPAHYSARGNQRIAQCVADALSSRLR
jgi:lysophospholipase L1-like esterase